MTGDPIAERLAVLEEVQAALWPRVLAGDPDAVDDWIRARAAHAAILGAPL